MTTVILNVTFVVNVCLKNSEGWGNKAGSSREGSLDLKSLERKGLGVACVSVVCAGCFSSPSPVRVLGDLHGWHGARWEGGCWLGQGWLPCSWLLIWSKFTLPGNQAGRQAGSPPWQRTQCKTVLSQFSPQTHHPEKPLFPTAGSPREHYS